AKLLDWDTIDWFARHALPPGVNRQDPDISPSFAADLSGLPPAVIVTAGVDPFTADAIGYGTALSSAGVPVTHLPYPGQIHGFVGMDRFFPAARDAIRRIAALIRAAEPTATPDAPADGHPPPALFVYSIPHDLLAELRMLRRLARRARARGVPQPTYAQFVEDAVTSPARSPIDLADPNHYADGIPHALLAQLRRTSPIVWVDEPATGTFPGGPGFWAVLRHADVAHVSRTPADFSSWRGTSMLRDPRPSDVKVLRRMMLNMDPPEHSKLRKIVNRAFTPQAIRRQRSEERRVGNGGRPGRCRDHKMKT